MVFRGGGIERRLEAMEFRGVGMRNTSDILQTNSILEEMRDFFYY